MKPMIKIWRNFRGEAVWQCIGHAYNSRHALIGRGSSVADAYAGWVEACDFPF